jgi:hypothetical protein
LLSEQDWRLWVGIGVSVASLIWNLSNTVYTYKTASRLRRHAIKLDEFKKSVRDPITAALEACDEVALRAEAIATSNKPLSDVLQEIEDLNRDAIKSFSRLSDKLDDADQSSFASSNTWLDGYDAAEGRVLGCFNEACNSVNAESKRRSALQRVKCDFRTYRLTIIRRIEAEINSIP